MGPALALAPGGCIAALATSNPAKAYKGGLEQVGQEVVASSVY